MSSSGHLTLAEHFLGLSLEDGILLFNVLSHFGTLLVILFFFWRDVWAFRRPLFWGTLPLFFFVPLFKLIKASFGVPSLLGISFAFTASILFLGDRVRFTLSQKWHPLFVGLAQTVALFPGVSRSGMTISSARILGWSADEAIKFSFLLAVPATMGALILEGWHLYKEGAEALPIAWEPLLLATITSFVVGLFSLRLIKTLGRMGKLGYFAWYCLAIAGLTLMLL